MKQLGFHIIVITLLSSINLPAQEVYSPEEQEVLEVFELFFDSMRERDTVALKSIISNRHAPYRFWQTSGVVNDGGIGGSGVTAKGFLKDVGTEVGLFGKCSNEFEDLSIKIYDQYAVVSAKYECFVNKGRVNNYGIYTLQFLKETKWKIFKVYSYRKLSNN
ncbi:MAG: hypothetical protein ACR2MX_03395 [Cyclobacteriaceae bacterium]